MFSGNTFLYIFLIFVFIFLLRYAYMRYYLRLHYRAHPPSTTRSPANTVNLAPYFIRLSAMQDARVQARRREEHLRATDLPPKYEDLVGYTNLAATDDKDQDMFLPDYSDCVVDTSEHYNVAADWPDHHQNNRPGRF
eukprot:TRINITY_DN27981_c0_g1_i1.p1 TRINITY_DN27981_c0_g1~~TRINITY_DN27981_c0_g1_i1.p1  ORF type:complete len:137 (+),score=44.78 TRINITY_DN27981_c0_g1_i1:41-451(+)